MAGIGNESATVAAAMEVKGVGMPTPTLEKQIAMENKEPFLTHIVESDDESMVEKPSEEDLHTLRRVPAKMPWIAFTVAFVELCERFAYYGTTAVSKFRLSSVSKRNALTLNSGKLHPATTSGRLNDR